MKRCAPVIRSDHSRDDRRDVPPAGKQRLSVVIPALDEETHVGAAIRSAREGGADEVLVVDGGSLDATREVARSAGAVVVEAPRGRGLQMNAGAARAQGELLLFLHADSVLPPDAAALVRRALGDPGVVAGAFAYRPAATGLLRLVLTVGARLRLLVTGHPYGDQGLFVRRRTFQALAGFADLPVMEDWEIVARLRRLGRVVVLRDPAVTSAESFEDHGLVRSTLVNAAVIAGYRLGVDRARLATWRKRIARRSQFS